MLALHTTTIENATKKNYYNLIQITDLRSNLNIEVSPSEGSIPGGGAIELEIKVNPSTVGSFDVRLSICIRESTQLNVRLAGTVEQPRITVQKVSLPYKSDIDSI